MEIEVTVDTHELEPHLKKAASLISEEVEIAGFRKGKAPYDMVKNRVGESTIYEKAADLAVRKTYPQVLEEMVNSKQLSKDYPPIGRPEVTVTKLAPGNELKYKVKFAILPKVLLPDYKAIASRVKKGKNEVAVAEEEVQSALEWMRDSRTKLVTVERAAKTGDRVEVDFDVHSSGVKIQSGDSQNHPLILGQGKFLPGFEDELIGMKAGDEKSFTLVVPETWHDTTLRGKALDFKVVLKKVEERQLPELTDEFAKSFGNFSSLDEAKASIREGILQEKREKEQQRLRVSMAEGIASGAKIEVPDVLIEAELGKIIQEFRGGIEGMGMKWEDYLLHLKKSPDDLKKGWKVEAEKRVRIALCLREIAKLEGIEPSDTEIEERAKQLFSQFKTIEEAEKNIDPVRSRTAEMSADARAHRTSNGVDPQSLREYTRGVLRNEKVFEFLEKV